MAINFAAKMLADAVTFPAICVVQTSTVNAQPRDPVDFQVYIPQCPTPVRYRTGSKFMGNKKAVGSFLEARKWDEFCVQSAISEKVEVVWSGYTPGPVTHSARYQLQAARTSCSRRGLMVAA